MRSPEFFEYIILIAVSILMAFSGLYLLANFNRLFRNITRNELLRKNAAAWVIIFCISTAMLPMNGVFFYMLQKYGWWKSILANLAKVTLVILVFYNIIRKVAIPILQDTEILYNQ